jgi:hypothetical protein
VFVSEKISAPIEKLKAIIESKRYIAESLDHEVLAFFGMFVLKNAFRQETIASYTAAYFEHLGGPGLEKTPFHVTEVKIKHENPLNDMLAEPELRRVASNFFGGNVGADFIRIVKKDKRNFLSVFLHQDTCYQIGSFERYSLFIPLTHCYYANGGLVLYPGTHNYGYLGDAGEISNVLPPGYPKVETNTRPGDVLIMHSGTWHESPENGELTDRVYLEVHIQDINEPTTKFVICGQRQTEWLLHLTEHELFVNSRTQRIKRLYEEVDRLKGVVV